MTEMTKASTHHANHHRRGSFISKAEHALAERLHHIRFLGSVKRSMHSIHDLLHSAEAEGAGGGEKKRRTGGWRLTADEEMEELERRVGKHHWRVRLVEYVEQNWIQVILILLLVLDVLCIVIELFLDAEYPNCRIVETLVKGCPAAAAGGGGGGGHRFLSAAGGAAASAGQCVAWDAIALAGNLKLTCAQGHDLHTTHLALFWTSVSILCIFDLELFALIAAYRALFFRNFLYAFDFVIVNASLILEVYIHIIHHDDDQDNDATYGILILVRCWRFVRIGHGIFESTEKHEGKVQERIKEQCHELKAHIAELEARMKPHPAAAAAGGGGGGGAKEKNEAAPGGGATTDVSAVALEVQ